jgi:hypothetical protein
MANLFLGKTALRFQYKDMTAANLAGATDITTAYSWFRIRQECKIVLFKNDFNVDLSVAVVHPEADAGVAANRQFLFEIGALSALNFDISGTVGLSVDAHAAFFVWQSGTGTPNPLSKFRVVAWG